MADHLDSVNKLLVRFNKMLERTDLPEQSRTHYQTVHAALTDAVMYAESLEEEIAQTQSAIETSPNAAWRSIGPSA